MTRYPEIRCVSEKFGKMMEKLLVSEEKNPYMIDNFHMLLTTKKTHFANSKWIYFIFFLANTLATIAPIVRFITIFATAGTAAKEPKCSMARVAASAELHIPV